jgi:succinate dehydrogenase / fumarate reductase, cytochrome b subunit
VIHVAQFWIPSRVTHDLEPVTYYGKDMHNLYLRMYETFQQEWVVILYLVGVGSLAFHLLHGFHSAFRSMGVHNKKYLVMLKTLGYGFTVIVSLLFALMPVSMYFQWVSPYN